MRVRLDLDERTYRALMQSAVLDMRSVTLQAEYLLRAQLGTLPALVANPTEDYPLSGADAHQEAPVPTAA